MRKKRVDIICMGCSKNLVDAELLAKQLEENGFETNFDPTKSSAKIVVINTCGFIGHAKEESINQILAFAEKRKQGKIDKLLVMGCLSGRYKEELTQEIPEVDKYYGKFSWKEVVADLGGEYRPQCAHTHKLSTPAHYAYVKISEGCNRRCAYCAIPSIRGKYRSRPMKAILREARALIASGCRELNVVAQDPMLWREKGSGIGDQGSGDMKTLYIDDICVDEKHRGHRRRGGRLLLCHRTPAQAPRRAGDSL